LFPIVKLIAPRIMLLATIIALNLDQIIRVLAIQTVRVV
jgi:hypothetical protein